jgi:TPR repeat protein
MIDLARINGITLNLSEEVEMLIKASLYEAVYNTSKNTQWIRLAGLPLGITTGIITTAKRVACIVEDVLIGLANIFGCFFNSKFRFTKGLSYLFMYTFIDAVFLPFSVGSAVFGVFQHTIMMAIDPAKFAGKELCEHDPKKGKEALLTDDEKTFRKFQERYDADNTDMEAIMYLLKAYFEAKGVEKDNQQAFYYALIAANNGNLTAMFFVGKCYLIGLGTELDYDKGFDWVKKAADGGNVFAQKKLVQLIQNQSQDVGRI